jgi:hypothetical protein
MLVDTINDFPLRKIPKKIDKELEYMNENVEEMYTSGHLSWEFDNIMEEYSLGLIRLNERWQEFIDRFKHKFSSEKQVKIEKRLQECALVLDKLKELYLSPPELRPKPKSIFFPEGQEPISFFTTCESKQSAINSALYKLSEIALERHGLTKQRIIGLCQNEKINWNYLFFGKIPAQYLLPLLM